MSIEIQTIEFIILLQLFNNRPSCPPVPPVLPAAVDDCSVTNVMTLSSGLTNLRVTLSRVKLVKFEI